MSLIVKNDLFDYPNRYIMQFDKGFKFSIDSILLAEFVNIRGSKKILDMCTGNGVVPLILSLKTNEHIVGFEIQESVAFLAMQSVLINDIKNIEIINDDVKNIGNYYKKKYFDIITCNPPFFKVTDGSFKNELESKSIARHEIKIDLETVFNIAYEYLKDSGVFYLVHRVERLDDIIYLGIVNNLNVKEVQVVTTRGNKVKILIVKCIKNSKRGIKFRDIVNVDNRDTYQHIFEGDCL